MNTNYSIEKEKKKNREIKKRNALSLLIFLHLQLARHSHHRQIKTTPIQMNIRILFTAILLTIASAAHADKWTEILDTYATDTTTHQIVLVKCTEGCNAEAEF